MHWRHNEHDGTPIPPEEWEFTIRGPDGSVVRRIPHQIEMAAVTGWLPDGKEPDALFDMWVMNADGSDQHRVLEGTGLADW